MKYAINESFVCKTLIFYESFFSEISHKSLSVSGSLRAHGLRFSWWVLLLSRDLFKAVFLVSPSDVPASSRAMETTPARVPTPTTTSLQLLPGIVLYVQYAYNVQRGLQYLVCVQLLPSHTQESS